MSHDVRRKWSNPGIGRRSPVPRRICLALAMACAGFHEASLAQLPSGANVVSGSATITDTGSVMSIRNSPNSIIDWQSFSIGSSNLVHFDQAGPGSQVLNRVFGGDASNILGSLSSNGRVWLINPNGVLFGSGARINVTGLTASTLSLTNADFLSGHGILQGEAGRPGATVVNQGEIATAFGGKVWLLGGSVRNEGLIHAPGGQILLAAGSSLEYVDAAAPNVTVRLSAAENGALNLGTLLAGGPASSVEMLGGMVNQQGVIRADSAGRDDAGRVVLQAQGNLTMGDTSLTSASALGSGSAGLIVATSSGNTLASGNVSATSPQGAGGRVQLFGEGVGLFGQATVDASGGSAGGEVLVGGDYQGRNPALSNAQAVYVGSGTRLSADATEYGNGGKVIVWSDRATRVYGSLSARGGAQGGNGGLIETSGAYLDPRPAATDTTARRGKAGTWLLDPNDILIESHDGVNRNIDDNAPPILTTTDDSAIVDTQYLVRAIAQGQEVIIRTGDAGGRSQAGNITVAGNVLVDPLQGCDASACTPGSLALLAHHDIVIQPNVEIAVSNGAMPLSLQAANGSILISDNARLDSGTGSMSLYANGSIAFGLGATLSSSAPGNAIVLRSGSLSNSAGFAALTAPNGRWLVHTDALSATQLDGLTADFVQFDVGPSTAPALENGNGILYTEPLNLWGRVARMYDGTAVATLDDSIRFSGSPSGFRVNVVQAGNGSFLDPNVGYDKPITTVSRPVVRVQDAADKMVYGYSTRYLGDISPAPLTFTASPVSSYVAQPLPVLDGNVSGFMGGESLKPDWTTGATPASPPGQYGITGSVKSANYLPMQAESNATALTLLPNEGPNMPTQQAVRSSEAANSAAQRIALPPIPLLTISGLLDLSSLARGQLFGPVRIGAMSQGDLVGLLDSRQEFKRRIFADSIYQLEIDPSLADIQPCSSAEEAGTGNCRITSEQVKQMQAARPVVPASVHKPTLPKIARKIAVLFGINDYADRRIPKLESPIPDVDAVARILSGMGYDVRVLRNPGKADIVRTFNQISSETSPADSVLVYYAGHGYSLDKKGAGYWIAADSPADDPRRWISNLDIARLMAANPSRQMGLITDSCYAGAFARDAINITDQVLDAGAVLDKRSVVVLTSGGDEPVTDEGKDGHSIFAWNLIQSLNSVSGWRAGSEVFRQVQVGVTREFPQTPRYGAVTAAGHQQGGDYLFEIR